MMLSLRSFPILTGLMAVGLVSGAPAQAHPLGNFTVNHYAGLEVQSTEIKVRYVVDMAEIPAVGALQAADADGDGRRTSAELQAYGRGLAESYAPNLRLQVDGKPAPLRLLGQRLTTPPGAGNLPTLRVECELAGTLPPSSAASRRVRFTAENHPDRIGWREIVVRPASGIAVYDSTAFGDGLTNELRAYPDELLALPLNERAAEFSFRKGELPAVAAALRTRGGAPLQPQRDHFAALISVRELTPLAALVGLLVAFVLGGVHALSPGHGKTVVGAYLVGSRGTARHALFLGLTVTVTHTAGVFALGLVTLFASNHILPERIFPVLTLVSGVLLVVVGANLLHQRIGGALLDGSGGEGDCNHSHGAGEDHEHPDFVAGLHSHGGAMHSHLPPGADGSAVTWKSLLGLGISGGLLPCPSALIVLLSAVALNRVGYGLLLVLAFSAGLASVLSAIGLAFVWAGRLLKHVGPPVWITRWAPIGGALAVTIAGIVICVQALAREGGQLLQWGAGAGAPSLALALSLLGSGLVFGVKHALEADHLAAVTAIVSERKSLWTSALVGGMWGIGHTVSLVAVGVLVLVLHVQVGERVALLLEFGVGIMLLVLGVNAVRTLRRGGTLHLHAHRHGERVHNHPHLHAPGQEDSPQSHHGLRPGLRPLVVGMIHGMAGSAALMLLVLSTVPSTALGFAFILMFGIGSIGGMMGMSALVGLPFHLTASRFGHLNVAVRGAAALFSVVIGLTMIYTIGFQDGLFR